MDRSDEALMREAFAQYWQKLEQAQQLRREADDLSSAWLDGPHAEHWEYLATALSDWVAKPNMIRRYTNLLAGGQTMPDVGTDVQARSIYQAQLLADADLDGRRAITPENQQLAVEGMHERARWGAAVSASINLAHPNVNGTPDPVRMDSTRTAPSAALSGIAGTDLDF